MNTTIIASKCHKEHVLMISNTTHLIVFKRLKSIMPVTAVYVPHNYLTLPLTHSCNELSICTNYTGPKKKLKERSQDES